MAKGQEFGLLLELELFFRRTDRTVRVVREAVKFNIDPLDKMYWDLWLGWNFAAVGFFESQKLKWTR